MHSTEILGPGDEDRVDAFLKQHADSSMFLRSNLRRSGLEDGEGRFHGRWIALTVEGAIVAVSGVFWNGVLQVQAPRFPAEAARQAQAASPRPLRGVVGPWLQVLAALEALGLQDAPTTMASREDLFSIPLTDLVVPAPLLSGRLSVRVAVADDVDLLTRWGVEYDVELKGHPADQRLIDENRTAAETYVGLGEQFVLEADNIPLSTCTWNAHLTDVVQIGGVWTPPSLRGRGYARAVVAGCLQIAEAIGVERSILFTGVTNRAARRAYEAIGFRRVGDYGIVLFEGEHPRAQP